MTVVVTRLPDVINVKNAPYNARGDGTTDDTVGAQLALSSGASEVFFPEGEYRTTSWLVVPSNTRVFGTGPASIISNDKTNATVDKRACLLVGNHHPALMAAQTKYALNNIAYGDDGVTCTTAGDAANFTVGGLCIVGSDTNISGVSRHAQLSKISAIAAGVITLEAPIEATITDAKIWTISGTDATTSTAISAIENVLVESLGFKGRAPVATKGAVYNGTFRDLHMIDTHLFFGTNMLTNVVIERMRGQYSGRYMEFAMNSYNVTARDWKGRFRPPAGLQAGETMVLPIHLGEQPYKVLLDDVQCHVDSRFTVSSELIQTKGSKLTMNHCDFRHEGSAGSYAVGIPDSAYTGFNFDSIVFEECRLDAASKARIVQIGGASVATENPSNVHFRGGELLGTPSGESIFFQACKSTSCSMTDRSGKSVKVGVTAEYPMLNGYRKVI